MGRVSVRDEELGRSRTWWALCLAGIVAVGILSRLVHTGFILLDKYLGDALYAAMVYAILRLWRSDGSVVGLAASAMLAIEAFQLTLIPARLLGSDWLVVRICARLLGTHFSFIDLLAYAAGIACVYAVDRAGRVY